MQKCLYYYKKKYSDIYISIKDDGIGCTDMKKGFGTRHIVERIKLLNGTVEFDEVMDLQQML